MRPHRMVADNIESQEIVPHGQCAMKWTKSSSVKLRKFFRSGYDGREKVQMMFEWFLSFNFFVKSKQGFFKMKLFTWAEIFCVGWAAFNDNCPNMEGVAECETNCETNFIECQVNCNGDAQCVSACNRIYATCEASCPCHDNCFEGQSFADENIQFY